MTKILLRFLCVGLVVFGGCSISFAGSILTYSLNTDFYSEFNSELLSASQGNLATTENYEDLDYLLNYDAIFLFGWGGSSLTSNEIANLTSYISTGKRIVLTGEGSPVSLEWNTIILDLVGGYSEVVDQHAFVVPIYDHQLTENISQVNFYAADRAVGGVQLFSENVATLWGENLNVLTILDGSMWTHVDAGPGYQWNNWLQANNAQFGANVANWLGASQPVPEPSTMLLFGTGIAGLVGVRFGRKKK